MLHSPGNEQNGQYLIDTQESIYSPSVCPWRYLSRSIHPPIRKRHNFLTGFGWCRECSAKFAPHRVERSLELSLSHIHAIHLTYRTARVTLHSVKSIKIDYVRLIDLVLMNTYRDLYDTLTLGRDDLVPFYLFFVDKSLL